VVKGADADPKMARSAEPPAGHGASLSPILPPEFFGSPVLSWFYALALRQFAPVSAFSPLGAALVAATAADSPRPNSARAAIASQIPPPELG
jgi:hypothetical protein